VPISREERRKIMKKLFFLLVGFFLLPVSAVASDYPTKPIDVIVAYAAGGGTDVGARVLAKVAPKYLSQPLVIVNKPGAGGEVGFMALAQAKPDGYTIGFINPPTIVMLPFQRKVGYKMSDFKYIINIMEDVGCLSVRAESKYKTLEDFILDARQKPGEVTVGNAGAGSDAHMTAVDIARRANISVNPVPFKGASEARTAVIGGHVDAAVMKVGEAKPYVESKQIRILGVAAGERLKDFPQVPTFGEKGILTAMTTTRAIAGPAGIPGAAVKYLHDRLKKTMEDPEFIELTQKTGVYVKYMTAEEYKKYIDGLEETYGPMWKEMGKK
jgi:tripartite-type tricarboxylate transporter receptor subunit TctC